MNKIGSIFLSLIFGLLTSILVPALFIFMQRVPFLGYISNQLLTGYLLVASIVEPIIMKIFSLSEWFPEGGAAGAFIVTLLSIVCLWMPLFSVLWFFGLRKLKSNREPKVS